MQARFQHTPRPSSDQFRQSSGILERNFFHYMPFCFSYTSMVTSLNSNDLKEAMQAFMEKRPPSYTGS